MTKRTNNDLQNICWKFHLGSMVSNCWKFHFSNKVSNCWKFHFGNKVSKIVEIQIMQQSKKT